MQTKIRQLITLVMVPCLLADPVLVSAQVLSLSPAANGVSTANPFEREALIARARHFLHEPAFDPERLSAMQMRLESHAVVGPVVKKLSNATFSDWAAIVPSRSQVAILILGVIYGLVIDREVGGAVTGMAGLLPGSLNTLGMRLERARKVTADQETVLANEISNRSALQALVDEKSSVLDQQAPTLASLARRISRYTQMKDGATLPSMKEAYDQQLKSAQAEVERIEASLAGAKAELETARTELAEQDEKVQSAQHALDASQARITVIERSILFVNKKSAITPEPAPVETPKKVWLLEKMPLPASIEKLIASGELDPRTIDPLAELGRAIMYLVATEPETPITHARLGAVLGKTGSAIGLMLNKRGLTTETLIAEAPAALQGDHATPEPGLVETPVEPVRESADIQPKEVADRTSDVETAIPDSLDFPLQRILAEPNGPTTLKPYEDAAVRLIQRGVTELTAVGISVEAGMQPNALSNQLNRWGTRMGAFRQYLSWKMNPEVESAPAPEPALVEAQVPAMALETPAPVVEVKAGEEGESAARFGDLPPSFQNIFSRGNGPSLLPYRDATLRLMAAGRTPYLSVISIEAGNKSSAALNNLLRTYGGGVEDYKRWIDLGMPMEFPEVKVAVNQEPDEQKTTESPEAPAPASGASAAAAPRKPAKSPRMVASVGAPKPIPPSIQTAFNRSEKVRRKLLGFANEVRRYYAVHGRLSLVATSKELGEHFTHINSYLAHQHIPAKDFIEFVAGLPDVGSAAPRSPHSDLPPATVSRAGVPDVTVPQSASAREDRRRVALLKRIRGDEAVTEGELRQLRIGNLLAMEALIDLVEGDRARFGPLTLTRFLEWYRKMEDRSRGATDHKPLNVRFNGGAKSDLQISRAKVRLRDYYEAEMLDQKRVDQAQRVKTPIVELQPPASVVEPKLPEVVTVRAAPVVSREETATPLAIERAIQRLSTLLASTRGSHRKGLDALRAGNLDGARAHFEGALKVLYGSQISNRLLFLGQEGKAHFGEALEQHALSDAVAAEELASDLEHLLMVIDARNAYQGHSDKVSMMDMGFDGLFRNVLRWGHVDLKDIQLLYTLRSGGKSALPFNGEDFLRIVNRRIPLVHPGVTVRVAGRSELYRMVTGDAAFKDALTKTTQALADQIESGAGASRGAVAERGRLLPQIVVYMIRTQPEVQQLFRQIYPQVAPLLDVPVVDQAPDEEVHQTDELTAYGQRLERLGLDPKRETPYTDEEFGEALLNFTSGRAARYAIYHQLMKTPASLRGRFHAGERSGPVTANPPAAQAVRVVDVLREVLEEVSPFSEALTPPSPEPSIEAPVDSSPLTPEVIDLAMSVQWPVALGLVSKAEEFKIEGDLYVEAGDKDKALEAYERASQAAKQALFGGTEVVYHPLTWGLHQMFEREIESSDSQKVDEIAAAVDRAEIMLKALEQAVPLAKSLNVQPAHPHSRIQKLVNQYAQDVLNAGYTRIRTPQDVARFVQSAAFQKAITRSAVELREQVSIVPARLAKQTRHELQQDEDVRLSRILALVLMLDVSAHDEFMRQYSGYSSRVARPAAETVSIHFENEAERKLYEKFREDVAEIGFPLDVEFTKGDMFTFVKGLSASRQAIVDAPFRRVVFKPIYPEKFRTPSKFLNEVGKKHLFAVSVLPTLAGYFFGPVAQGVVALAAIVALVSYGGYVLALYARDADWVRRAFAALTDRVKGVPSLPASVLRYATAA